MPRKLTAKQQRFVQEYFLDYNATQAAARAGYGDPNIGRQLITKDNVLAEIQARQAALAEKLEITQERVLQKLAAIAFADLPDFVKIETVPVERLGVHPITGELITLPDGCRQRVKVADTNELTNVQSAAIASIKQGAHGIEVKLHNKVRALEQLGKHLGLFDVNAASPPSQANNLFDAIVGSAGEDLAVDDLPELSKVEPQHVEPEPKEGEPDGGEQAKARGNRRERLSLRRKTQDITTD